MPFRQGGKNDGNDALAIAIAARQPTMRFVPVKTVEQQAILAWHRMRQGWIEERTALLNRVRGLLAEFGLVPGRSPAVLIAAMARLVDEGTAPAPLRAIVQQAREQLHQLDARLGACDVQIQAHARQSPQAERLRALLGVGPITASAVVAKRARSHVFSARALTSCATVPNVDNDGRPGRFIGRAFGTTTTSVLSNGSTTFTKCSISSDGEKICLFLDLDHG